VTKKVDMKNNLKMRKAIILATTVVSSVYTFNAFAIGLGDMQVKSYLGQPLVAELKVYGLDSKADSSCFNVKSDDNNTINQVSFNLSHKGNGNGILRIKSRMPVIEPIASLSIMNSCESTFTRQYNLLIDPAPATSAGMGLMVQTSNNDKDINNSFNTSANDNFDTVVVDSKPARKSKSRAKSKRTRASSAVASIPQNVEPLTDATLSQSHSEVAQTNPSARLTISAGEMINAMVSPSNMQLNLDKSINTNRAVENVDPLTQTDFADEFTVMQNRISHLDKQLSALSVQNATLKIQTTAQGKEIQEVKQQNDFLKIVSFCLGGALLASSYFFIDWLRRRNAKIKQDKEQALWHAMEQEQEEADSKHTFKIDEDFASKASSTHIEVFDSEDMSEFEKEFDNKALSNNMSNVFKLHTPPADIVQEDTQILDDADLFVSHGRKSLAIQLLQSHLMENPKDSASIWMYLLDLLAKEGLEKEYDIAAKECKKHFNFNVAEFEEANIDENSLESYERITNALQKVWGTPEAVQFLDELIYNTRMEPRMGFSKSVFEELVLLREIAHDEIRLAPAENKSNVTNPLTSKQDKPMTLNLPEIEVSDEFKLFGMHLEEKNAPKKPEAEGFEFELVDIALR
jgi:hypothetical protein